MTESRLRGQRLQWTLALTGALAWVLQGYDESLMNSLVTLPAFYTTFPEIDVATPGLKDKNSLLQGTVVSLFEVGAAVGGVLCYLVGDKLGRKRMTVLATVFLLVGAVLQAASYHLAQLIVGRIAAGIGLGTITATVPTWVTESCEAEHRGRFVMVEGSGATFGLMFVIWLELGCYFIPNGSASWRFPVAFQAVFPLAVLAVLPLLNESPRWLIAQDRHDEGKKIIGCLIDEEEDSDLVTLRAQIIQQSVAEDQATGPGNPFALTPNRHLNRTLLAIGLGVIVKLTGSSVIAIYSNAIFQGTLGYTAINARIISGCLQTWHFFCAIAAVWLVDRFGRRPILIVCAVLMAISQAGLAGLTSIANNHIAAGCILAFYFIALAAFAVGGLLLPFMYASEISPLRIRTQITAMASCIVWLMDFLVAEVSPFALANIGWKYYLFFTAVNCISAVLYYLFFPETKNGTLEDIDDVFLAANNSFQPVQIARAMKGNFGLGYTQEVDEKSGALHVERAA